MRLPSPGDVFEGRFFVERELGAGGFSNVYLVRNQALGRQAALKILLPEDGGYSLETRARFAREVAVIANLSHRNTVTLYDQGESRDGLLYIVFEYVPGEDLFDLLQREGQLDGSTVRAILTQVLGALAEAHDAGIIHRDIKPQNIRVCSPPGAPIAVKLLDFGIARGTDHGSPSITKTGELIGTPRYMSPEQLKERQLTAAADIYSLGMVAFELLVGSDALPGSRWADQLERLRTGHVFTGSFLKSAGTDLVEVIQRMTAVDPVQRFPSASATLAALGVKPTLENRRTTKLDPIPDAVSQTSPGWRRFAPVGVVALLLVCVGALLWNNREEPAPRRLPIATAEDRAALMKRDTLPKLEPPVVHEDGPDLGVDLGPVRASTGCGVAMPDTPRIEIHAPPDLDPEEPLPLIIWIHSNNQNDPGAVPRSASFARLITTERVIVAAPYTPDTLLNSWGTAHLAALEEAKSLVLSQYCVDPSRVYVWSSAGGGDLGALVACQRWTAGVVISNYVETSDARTECPNARPLLWVAARHSLHQPIRGGPDCLVGTRAAFAMSVERKKLQHECGEEADVTIDEGFVRCERFRCDVPFEACEVDGGLGWPGTPQPKAARKMQEFCPEPAPEPRFDLARHAWGFFEGLAEDP